MAEWKPMLEEIRRPLQGIRVLNLSRFIAGPFCTSVLADMGAEVIEVEPPGGDGKRREGVIHNGESLQWQLYHRNKKAITLNLRSDEGKELLRALIRTADVVVENYRPGTFEKMGFGFPALQDLKPDIILLSISGFGQAGPLAEMPVFDAIAQAMSGVMSLNGHQDGDPVVLGPGFFADVNAGTWAVAAVMLALFFRQRTGLGQHVDVSLLETMMPYLTTMVPDYLATGRPPRRYGNGDRWAAPCNLYHTRDGAVYLDAGTDTLFQRLFQVIGMSEVIEDPRFKEFESRAEHSAELDRIVEGWMRERTTREVLEVVQRVVPVGPVRTVPEIAECPQLSAREFFVELDDPRLRGIRFPSVPVRLNGSACEVKTSAPSPGADNSSVYGDLLRLSMERLDALRRAGVI